MFEPNPPHQFIGKVLPQEILVTWLNSKMLERTLAMAEHYSNLNPKDIKETEEFWAKGNSVQASEKLWGATLRL